MREMKTPPHPVHKLGEAMNIESATTCLDDEMTSHSKSYQLAVIILIAEVAVHKVRHSTAKWYNSELLRLSPIPNTE